MRRTTKELETGFLNFIRGLSNNLNHLHKDIKISFSFLGDFIELESPDHKVSLSPEDLARLLELDSDSFLTRAIHIAFREKGTISFKETEEGYSDVFITCEKCEKVTIALDRFD